MEELFGVARCEITAEEMVDRVLDSVMDPNVLESCCHDPRKVHDYFCQKFNAIRDHIGFFFPGTIWL